MPFAVVCIDRPETAAIRAATRLAHLEYINPHRPKMRIGGALLNDKGDERIGMMFAIDLPTREAVEAFMGDEPYNKAGIFEMVLIRRIHIVYPETDPSMLDKLLIEERNKARA